MDAWQKLLGELNLSNPKVGEERRLAAKSSSPVLAGVIERIDDTKHDTLLMRLHRPAPGVAVLSTFGWGDRTHVSMGLYFYGEEAAPVAAREEAAWQAWMAQNFPQAKD